MTLAILPDETQRAYVERVLLAEGSISTHEVMYDLVNVYGHPKRITRLAPVIEMLRKAGWEIRTIAPPGQQAVYRLLRAPVFAGHPIGKPRPCPSCHQEHAAGRTCAWAVTA